MECDLAPHLEKALRHAHAIFQMCLVDSPGAAYLEGRGVSAAMRTVAGFGYAPPGFLSMLLSHFGGVSPADLLSVGIDSSLEGRLTFPWWSLGGSHLLALGGRTVAPDDRRAKYFNPYKSLWWAKGRSLFGVPAALPGIVANGAIVVEGPFDAVALWGMGYTHAVATVGAKITADQLFMLARFTDSITVLLDNDEGGRRGRDELIKIVGDGLLPPSLTVSATTLRGAKDPAEATPEQIAEALANPFPISKEPLDRTKTRVVRSTT